MVGEVVEDSSDSGSGHIGASDDEKVALGPEFRHRETFACLGVFGVEEIVKEVLSVAVISLLGSLKGLGFAEGHEIPAVADEVGKEDLVKSKFVDDG